MDFEPGETQRDVAELARRIFAGDASWRRLAEAGLLGVGVPEALGGSGGGLLEVCALLEEQGRATFEAPLLHGLAAALALADLGRDLERFVAGEELVVAALDGLAPAADRAHRLLVDAGDRLLLVDPRRATLAPQIATTGETVWQVIAAAGEELPGLEAFRARATVMVCALHLGVAERALAMTARYTAERRQFGRPIASFQAVAHRAADAWIDVEAMRLTLWRAAWLVAERRDARAEIAIAKSWACEAGHRVALAAQHLHGGIGFDASYPLGRCYLWSKQLELTLGSAGSHLARLGAGLRNPR